MTDNAPTTASSHLVQRTCTAEESAQQAVFQYAAEATQILTFDMVK